MWTSAFLFLLVVDESLLLMAKSDLQVSLPLWTSACYDNHACCTRIGLDDPFYRRSRTLSWTAFPTKPFWNIIMIIIITFDYIIKKKWRHLHVSMCRGCFPPSCRFYRKKKNNVETTLPASPLFEKSWSNTLHLLSLQDHIKVSTIYATVLMNVRGQKINFFLPLKLYFQEQCSIIFAH